MNGKILSFGELLLRITPDADGQWLQQNSLPFYVGGAELNVAAAIALWGLPSAYLTALPQNSLSAQIISYLQAKGIDLSRVYHHDHRMGLYFLTRGQDMKHDALIYDRADSAFARLQPGMIDWDAALSGISWFHFSAICPAVSLSAASVCREALEAASYKGITVSVDLNHRVKLWQYGKTPMAVMPELVQYCDIVMGNIWAAETMLGIPVKPDIDKSQQQSAYLEAAQQTAASIKRQFPKCRAVANTFRFDAGAEVRYYSALQAGDAFYPSQSYLAGRIADKVGSGDCYMAGLIYGFYNGWPGQQIVEFATAAAFTKLFINNDATNKTVAEIQQAITT